MRATPTRFCGFLILSVYLAGCNSGYKSKPVMAAATQISISPTGAIAGSPDFTLTITGSNGQFYNSTDNLSQAVWLVNGTNNALPTTFVSNTMLTAVIPAALLSNPVKAQVFVETEEPKGSPHPRGQTQSFLTLRQAHRDRRFRSRLRACCPEVPTSL